MRFGTLGLDTMAWPRPASVGARIAARMPASQIDNCPKTIIAASMPRPMVSNMPTLNNLAGSELMPPTDLRSIRLASVNSSSTSPSSATVRNAPA
jgi:hypothetical protein